MNTLETIVKALKELKEENTNLIGRKYPEYAEEKPMTASQLLVKLEKEEKECKCQVIICDQHKDSDIKVTIDQNPTKQEEKKFCCPDCKRCWPSSDVLCKPEGQDVTTCFNCSVARKEGFIMTSNNTKGHKMTMGGGGCGSICTKCWFEEGKHAPSCPGYKENNELSLLAENSLLRKKLEFCETVMNEILLDDKEPLDIEIKAIKQIVSNALAQIKEIG